MNWTPILIALISVFAVLFEEILRRYAVPWLKSNNLIETAKYAVQAAEAMYGRFNGDEKLRQALNLMKEKGFDVETDEVLNAIKAAWKEMDIEQIAAGIKTIEPAE